MCRNCLLAVINCLVTDLHDGLVGVKCIAYGHKADADLMQKRCTTRRQIGIVGVSGLIPSPQPGQLTSFSASKVVTFRYSADVAFALAKLVDGRCNSWIGVGLCLMFRLHGIRGPHSRSANSTAEVGSFVAP